MNHILLIDCTRYIVSSHFEKRFVMKVTWLLAFMAVATQAGRVKRAAIKNCQTNPSEMDSKNVVDKDGTFTMSCTSDTQVLSCIWRHTDPITEETQGSSANPTILCASGKDDNGRQCVSETRVTYRNSQSTCALDVASSEPEDTGKWILAAVTLSSNGQQVQVISSRLLNGMFCLYTHATFLRKLTTHSRCTPLISLWWSLWTRRTIDPQPELIHGTIGIRKKTSGGKAQGASRPSSSPAGPMVAVQNLNLFGLLAMTTMM